MTIRYHIGRDREMTDKEKLAEAERIRQENLKRISSSEYRRQERRVARVERAIRREVR